MPKPRKTRHFTRYREPVATAVQAMAVCSTYTIRANLADFYGCVTGQRRRDVPGSEIVRDITFTPTKRHDGRDIVVLIGQGVVDGERVPGVCRVVADAHCRSVRVGLGFDPDDTRRPIGKPGMMANGWLGATSDDVWSVV